MFFKLVDFLIDWLLILLKNSFLIFVASAVSDDFRSSLTRIMFWWACLGFSVLTCLYQMATTNTFAFGVIFFFYSADLFEKVKYLLTCYFTLLIEFWEYILSEKEKCHALPASE